MSTNMRSVRLSRSGIARRIVSLPMNIIGGVSRAVGQGISMIGGGGGGGDGAAATARRDEPPQVHVQRQQPPQPQHPPLMIPGEWAFITSFEQQYGPSHPFFYACRFVEAMKMAEQESKPLFLYLHSAEHPYTPPFCRETLGSELVVQFLDANFISWAAIANSGEGFRMATSLRVASFPFCAVVMPLSGSGDNIAVLQQVEGPVSPAQLVEILQSSIEELGSAFRVTRAAEEEARVANRLLRQEQDAAYNAALRMDMDKEKERVKESEMTGAACQQQSGKQVEGPKGKIEKPKHSPPPPHPAPPKHPASKAKQPIREAQGKETAATTAAGKDTMVTQIQIRFPSGGRKEQTFLCTDKIQSVYRFIDSLDLAGVGAYQLVSNFPRKVYGLEHMGLTLKEAGLHPRASLFVELV